MKVTEFEHTGSWRDVANAARTTVGMDHKEYGDPSDRWKRQMLLAEHSPIRILHFSWTWIDMPSWVSVHFVRHKVGVEHFVSTQRADRTGVPRDELPQGALVRHTCHANAQAMITISRKRRCGKASAETQAAWYQVLDALKLVDPVLAEVCVPECIYRGFCPEPQSCGMFPLCGKLRERYTGETTL